MREVSAGHRKPYCYVRTMWSRHRSPKTTVPRNGMEGRRVEATGQAGCILGERFPARGRIVGREGNCTLGVLGARDAVIRQMSSTVQSLQSQNVLSKQRCYALCNASGDDLIL